MSDLILRSVLLRVSKYEAANVTPFVMAGLRPGHQRLHSIAASQTGCPWQARA